MPSHEETLIFCFLPLLPRDGYPDSAAFAVQNVLALPERAFAIDNSSQQLDKSWQETTEIHS